MTARVSKPNAVLIPILILFGINMVLSAINITQWITRDNFRSFSESTASDMVQQLKPRAIAAAANLHSNTSSDQIRQAFDAALLSGTVVAYELFDRDGRFILFGSLQPDGSPSSDLQLISGRDHFAGSGPTGRYSHAEFVIPGNASNAVRLRIYIDQSNALELFYAIDKNFAIISALFLAAALSLLIYVVWSRLKEQWRADDRIRHLAHYDGLTDLPKRELFFDKLSYALSRLEDDRTAIALLCLDIDNFKQVNDTMGHAAGDALLKQFADRLRDNTRKSDFLCRLGGDEFAVALCDLKSAERILPFANRLCRVLGEPYAVDGHKITTSVSIGIAMAPMKAEEAPTLLKYADLALYRSKSEGRNTVRFFEDEMDVAFQRRLQLGQELKSAIEANQFVLYYQRQLDLKTERLTGHEALVRWLHPTKGLIPPDQFIPMAEETGLIIPLSQWILHRACTDAKTWRGDHKLAINLSPLQFAAGNVADLVAATLKRTGFPASRLELEITESLLMSNTPRVIEELCKLKEMGVHIVLDDFGTGYSSLSYLASFPFDKIKIDRSFIANLASNPIADVIVRSIISLGHDLNMTITAEGVETKDQEAILRSCGCDQVQGFLYGRPIPQSVAKPARKHKTAVTRPSLVDGLTSARLNARPIRRRPALT